MSELVESALRQALREPQPARRLPPLPVHSSAGVREDIADRKTLYDAMGR